VYFLERSLPLGSAFNRGSSSSLSEPAKFPNSNGKSMCKERQSERSQKSENTLLLAIRCDKAPHGGMIINKPSFNATMMAFPLFDPPDDHFPNRTWPIRTIYLPATNRSHLIKPV